MTRQAAGAARAHVVRGPRAFNQDPRPFADGARGRAVLAGLDDPRPVGLDRPVALGPLDATALHGAVVAVLRAVGRDDLVDARPVLALLLAAREGVPMPTPEAVALGRFCEVFGGVDEVLGAGLRRLLNTLWLVDRVGVVPGHGARP